MRTVVAVVRSLPEDAGPCHPSVVPGRVAVFDLEVERLPVDQIDLESREDVVVVRETVGHLVDGVGPTCAPRARVGAGAEHFDVETRVRGIDFLDRDTNLGGGDRKGEGCEGGQSDDETFHDGTPWFS